MEFLLKKKQSSLFFLVGFFSILGCSDMHQNYPQFKSFPLGTIESAVVNIKTSKAELFVSSTNTDNLLISKFQYRMPTQVPNLAFELNKEKTEGYLDIRQMEFSSVGTFPVEPGYNIWNLLLANKVPISLSVTVDKGIAKLDLANLYLKKLKVETQEGDVEIELSNSFKQFAKVDIYQNEENEIKIVLPKNVGIKLFLVKEIEGLKDLGFIQKEEGVNVFENESYKDSKIKVEFSVFKQNGLITFE